MRTSKNELKQDLLAFLYLYDEVADGSARCPLCNNSSCDYSSLTDEEVNEAVTELLIEFPCSPDWRQRRIVNLGKRNEFLA